MSEVFMGEIRLFPYSFAPRSWAYCNGQLLAIAQNQALFSLLGTFYGGNGTTNFALPNLSGRVPIGFGNADFSSSFSLGQTGGSERHTLSLNEMPVHNHIMRASSDAATSVVPTNNFLGVVEGGYGPPSTAFDGTVLASSGSSTPHENRQPYLAVPYCIALQGIYPSRN